MKGDAMKSSVHSKTIDRDAKGTDYEEHILTLTTATDHAFVDQQESDDAKPTRTQDQTKPLQDLSEEEMLKMALEQSLRETSTPLHPPETAENATTTTSTVYEKSASVLNRAGRAATKKEKEGSSSHRVGAFPVGGTGRNQDGGELEDLTVNAIVVNNDSMEDLMENGNLLPVAYTVSAELAPSEEHRLKDNNNQTIDDNQKPEEAPRKKRQCASTRNLAILLVVLLLLAAGGVVGVILATRNSNGSSSSSSTSSTTNDHDPKEDPRSNTNPLCSPNDPQCNDHPGPDIDSPECDLDPICAETKAKGGGGP